MSSDSDATTAVGPDEVNTTSPAGAGRLAADMLDATGYAIHELGPGFEARDMGVAGDPAPRYLVEQTVERPLPGVRRAGPLDRVRHHPGLDRFERRLRSVAFQRLARFLEGLGQLADPRVARAQDRGELADDILAGEFVELRDHDGRGPAAPGGTHGFGGDFGGPAMALRGSGVDAIERHLAPQPVLAKAACLALAGGRKTVVIVALEVGGLPMADKSQLGGG